MAYNPKIHHRRSISLKGYVYSQAGLYFITICAYERKCVFGKIENNEMVLNHFGIVAMNQWIKLAVRYPNFELDVFQIMPNHMHGIIMLNNVGAGFTPAPIENQIASTGQPQGIALTISDMIGAYKSLVANECLEIFKNKNPGIFMGKLWQRNYYKHIVRNESSYKRISEYIINNPNNWKDDKLFDE